MPPGFGDGAPGRRPLARGRVARLCRAAVERDRGAGLLRVQLARRLSARRARRARSVPAHRTTDGCGCCRSPSRSRCRSRHRATHRVRPGGGAPSRSPQDARARASLARSRSRSTSRAGRGRRSPSLFGELPGRQPGLGYGALLRRRRVADVPLPRSRASRLGQGRRIRRRRDRRIGRAGRLVHAVSDFAPVRPRVPRSRRSRVAGRADDTTRVEQDLGLRRRRLELAAARPHDRDRRRRCWRSASR